MRVIISLIVVLGLCIGAFHLVENRHDSELRTENAELTKILADTKIWANKQIGDAKQLEEERVVELVILAFPDDYKKIEKLFPGVAARAEESAKARTISVKKEKSDE